MSPGTEGEPTQGMINGIAQQIAALTAPFLVVLFGAAVWLAVRTYGPTRLRAHLLLVIRDDLRAFVQFPAALSSRERDTVQEAFDELETKLYALTVDEIQTEEVRSYEFAEKLYRAAGATFGADDVAARATAAMEQASKRLRDWVEICSPAHIARRWKPWTRVEEARALLRALRDVGAATVRVLLHRAAVPAGVWTAGGGLVSVFVWTLAPGDEPDFVDFFGTGGALGLYAGLWATAIRLVREVHDREWREWRSAPRTMKIAFALFVAVSIAMLMLLHQGVIPLGGPAEPGA